MEKWINDHFHSNAPYKTLFLNLCILLVYTISGKIGLSFASVNPSASAIWPPTGITLAAILLFGNRVAPAIFVGAFIVNVSTAGTILTSLGIASGNTLEGIVGAYLVKRFANGTHAFSTVADVLKFFFFAAILSTTISADIGVLTLISGKLAQWNNFIIIWLTWWLGDMGGSFIIAPLLLIWATSSKIHFYFREIVHILLAFFVLLFITWLVFSGILPYVYLCIPVAVWIAFWFGRKGATITTVLVASIALFYTLHGLGPFANGFSQSIILLQLFLGILSLTSLTFAALVHTIRKGEKKLAFYETRFKSLIEKSFDAIVLIDATSTILYASPSVKRILGYEPEELVGMTGFDLVFSEDRQMTMQTLAKLAFKPGNTITVEYRVLQKNKKIIWVEATGTNLLFDPTINAVIINFHDITEQKALQEKMLQEKTQDEAMLASIGDGIIAINTTGKIAMVNHSASEMLGWKQKELIGKSIFAVIPIENEAGEVIPIAERPMTKVLTLHKKMVTSQTYYYIRKDKSKIPVRFTVAPIEIEGEIVGIIEVFHDITKEKEIEQMKDEFISMASHELRTPMTAVNGLLSMISQGDYGPINEKLKHPLDNIQISAKRQIHLINDLLDVSRLQTGKIEITLIEFPLRQALEEVVKALMPIAQQKKLKLILQTKEEVMVYADIEWAKHIMNNLIGNALKFTNNGSVSITYRSDNNFVSVAVTDTGIGIAPADQNKLFGKFQQLEEQTSGKPPGSGLGLYLSRELARKMEGDVRLTQSKVDNGSTFTFILPRAQSNILSKTQTKQIDKKKIAFSLNKR